MVSSILLAIVLLPAIGALINGTRAFAKPLTPKNRTITNLIALGTTGLSAVLAAFVVFTYPGTPQQFTYYSWIPAGLGEVIGSRLASFNVDFAFRVDPLSCTM